MVLDYFTIKNNDVYIIASISNTLMPLEWVFIKSQVTFLPLLFQLEEKFKLLNFPINKLVDCCVNS